MPLRSKARVGEKEALILILIFFFFFFNENISSFKSNKLRWIHADVFHIKLILKGARHSSKSYDSARHFYSDKLHHKDKWKRRNYCSRRSPIAATKQCTSSSLLLYH